MTSRQLQIGCDIRHSATMRTAAVFQVAARDTARVPLSDVWFSFDGRQEMQHYTDNFGNHCIRVTLPEGISTFSYRAIAHVPDEVDEADEEAAEIPPVDLPHETLGFTLASRFCHSDVFSSNAWQRFGSLPPGYQRVRAIMDYVWNHLRYTTGSTNSLATATDVYATGAGVCRDFAHLMIVFCRALNIPARYAYGYLPDLDVPPLPTPMDFHAWVQVYLGGRWYDFDPRWNARRKGRVQIGYGRDAADSALVTTYGAPWLQNMNVLAHETQEG